MAGGGRPPRTLRALGAAASGREPLAARAAGEGGVYSAGVKGANAAQMRPASPGVHVELRLGGAAEVRVAVGRDIRVGKLPGDRVVVQIGEGERGR